MAFVLNTSRAVCTVCTVCVVWYYFSANFFCKKIFRFDALLHYCQGASSLLHGACRFGAEHYISNFFYIANIFSRSMPSTLRFCAPDLMLHSPTCGVLEWPRPRPSGRRPSPCRAPRRRWYSPSGPCGSCRAPSGGRKASACRPRVSSPGVRHP